MHRLLSAALLLVACARPAPAPARRPPAVRRPSAPAIARPAPPPGPLTTRYAQSWPGLDAVLLGVDAERGRAFVRLRRQGERPRYLIDTIDLERGERIARWEAAPASAAHLAEFDERFHPLGDAADAGARHDDLARLATMVASWRAGRQRAPGGWLVGDASPDARRVVYTRAPDDGKDGDWLFLYDVHERTAARIDRGVVASYDVAFSPDGRHLAFRGCVGRRPCRYALYLAPADGAPRGRRPLRLTGLADPSAPVWTEGGELLVLAGRERCALALSPRDPERPRRLACDPHLSRLALSGERLIAASTRRHGDRWVADLRWQHVGGEQLALRSIEGVSDLSLGSTGLVLADHVTGLLALDMQSDRRRLLPSAEGFVYVPSIHWLDDRRALLLNKRFDGERIALVEMDVERFLAGE